MVKRLLQLAGMVAVAAIGIAAARGQSSPAAPQLSGSSSDQLLVEVRALRAEMNQVAESSIRAQLFVARLQLQERRVNTVARQLLDVQNSLSAVRQAQAGVRERLAATEEGQNRLAPEDRSDDQIRAMRLQVEQGQVREGELVAQESALIAAASAEQTRWSDFNERLDALERSLSTGKSR
jgi:hypothetical protein